MTPEERLREVEAILFPPATRNADGSRTLHDADENLGAALYDLRRLGADAVCIKTIQAVLEQLNRARNIIGCPPWHKKPVAK